MIYEGLYHASVLSQQMIAAGGKGFASNLAYLDPGTGSLIIQMAIGGLVGGLVGARLFWNRITSSFTRVFNRTSRLARTDK